MFGIIRDWNGDSPFQIPGLIFCWFSGLIFHIQNFFPRMVMRKFFVRNELNGTLLVWNGLTARNFQKDRSSHRRCSVKKGVLRRFIKFTGKRLRPATFIKKETLAQVFSYKFCEIFKNTFFYGTPPLSASEKKTLQVSITVLSIEC